MKTVGIVAEYNPFHKGHAYHIEESIGKTGADAVIAVMSGNFVQRGEPAAFNKNARARAAIESGADLVLDLPAAYSLSSAEMFAYGSVGILEATGVVDYLCFGSETGRVEEIARAADFLIEENDEYKSILKEFLENGKPYAEASFEALKRTFENPEMINQLANSNNILAIEYIKSLRKYKSNITPVAIKRVDNDYNDKHMTGVISSATAIRECITREGIDAAGSSVTASSEKIIRGEINSGRGPVTIDNFEDIILWTIRSMTETEISSINGINEGLEFRLKAAAEDSGTITELISKIKSRRYPEATVKRLLFNVVLGITKDDFEIFKTIKYPGYIKVLDFNDKGRKILACMKKTAGVPVITKASKLRSIDNYSTKRLLGINQKASDLYVLGYRNKTQRYGGQEFTTNNYKHF